MQAPCPEIYVLDTKCLGGEVLPPVQKKMQSRKQEPSTRSYPLPLEAKSHGKTTGQSCWWIVILVWIPW